MTRRGVGEGDGPGRLDGDHPAAGSDVLPVSQTVAREKTSYRAVSSSAGRERPTPAPSTSLGVSRASPMSPFGVVAHVDRCRPQKRQELPVALREGGYVPAHGLE